MTTAEMSAAAAAGPPAWADGQWSTFTMALQEWWNARPEQLTDRRLAMLAMAIANKRFTAEQAMGALTRLLDAGHEYPPKAVDIVNAIHTDRGAPTWTEAHALLLERPGGVIHARIPAGARPAGEADRQRLREQAMLERANDLHEMIGAFVAAYGPGRLELVSGRIAYGEYGAIELERLRDEWEQFVERADARRREGMPLLTAPLAARRELGMRRLDPLAHITGGQTDA